MTKSTLEQEKDDERRIKNAIFGASVLLVFTKALRSSEVEVLANLSDDDIREVFWDCLEIKE